jgi:hypothetical protein
MSREAKVLITSENKSRAGIKSATDDVLGFGEATKKVGDTIQNAFKVLTIAKFAQEVGKFAFDSVKAFGEVERKMTQLKVAVGGSDESFGRLNSHIQKLSSLTLASKGEVQDLVARLAALGKSDADIERISSAAVHLANVTGQGLNEAMKQVTATFAGSTGELGKLLPELRGLTKEQLASGDAVDILNAKFGGLSEQMAKGVSQSLKNVSDNFGDLKENIGQGLVGVFEPMIRGINSIIEGWNKAFESYFRYKRAQEEDPELARLLKAEMDKQKALDAFLRSKGSIAGDALRAGDPQREQRLRAEVEAARKEVAAYEEQRKAAEAARLGPATRGVDTPDLSAGAGVRGAAAGGSKAGSTAASSGKSVWETPGGQQFLAEAAEAFYGVGTAYSDYLAGNLPSIMPVGTPDIMGDMSPLTLLAEAISPVVERFGGLISSLGTVKSIMDPIGLVLEGFMEVLGPLIDEALAPLVSVFKLLGQLLAKTLIPVINILAPVIKGIADMFVWFANKVIIPVGNFFIDILRGVIRALNRIPFVSIREPGRLENISLDTTTGSGGGAGGGASGGTGASYTGSRPITFNFYNQGNVVGSGGLEELAMIIESLIRRNERYA